jgi:hypothetical protein
MKKLFLSVMIILLGGGLLFAQNTIDVSGLKVEAGTVTFNVEWSDAGASNLWSDTVWVFVDYNKNGRMARMELLLGAGATLTDTSSPGVGALVEENIKGAWVVGDARTNAAGSFSATVQLLTATADLYGACAYASSYPPVGQYVSPSEIVFTGTPMYEVTLIPEGGGAAETVSSGSTFLLPCDYTMSSFTDATGAPGIINCLKPTGLTLASPFAAVCAGTTVTLTASASGAASYSINGTDWQTSPVFEVSPSSTTPYTLYAKTDKGCVAALADAAVVTVNPLPNAPTSPSSNSRCGNGTVAFSATVPSGHTIDWYTTSNGTTLVSGGSSVTSISPSLTVTTTYHAQARNTTTGCVSATRRAVTGTVNPIPGVPTISGKTSYCTSGTITAAAGTNGNGIRWDNTSTTPLRTVNTTGTNVYSAVTTSNRGCESGAASISVTINQPGGDGESAACGCVVDLVACSNGTCQTSCGQFTLCIGAPYCYSCTFTEVSDAPYDGNGVNWSTADAICTGKGPGWRLPNGSELWCMCNNKASLPGGYIGAYYWDDHSDRADNHDLVLFNDDCKTYYTPDYNPHAVRCVK